MKLNELMVSETQPKEPTYSGNVGFDVISAIENEQKASKDVERKNLADFLKKRSDFRLELRTWKQTMWDKEVDKKTVNTSSLADTFTDIMVWMGKDPKYMQDTYWSSQWNMDLINKMKAIQGGKFSGDIQNYIDGRNTDLTWLVTNMFPDYMAKKNWIQTNVTAQTTTTPTKKAEVNQPLTSDTRSAWDKMVDKTVNFQWSDVWLASEKKPIKWLLNILWWFIDTTEKIIPWTMDIFYELTTTSPDKFNQYLDEWYYVQNWVKKNAKEAYDRAVKYQWYNGTYNQWVSDAKNSYAQMYEMNTSWTDEIDEGRWDFWFNTMDEESRQFKAWELGSEVIQQIMLDKWLSKAAAEWAKLYKAARGAERTAKWTELAAKWTELVAKWEEVLSNPKTMQESKNIAKKMVDWFNKPWAKQEILKAWAEWGKAWLEYQLIWDVQNWQLSTPQAYWVSAWLWVIFWTIAWALNAWAEWITVPREQLQTSLKRLWWEDTAQILDWAEAWAKDWTLPSALQQTTDMAVKEAKENVKNQLSKAWQELWSFRKNMWWSDLWINDFNSTINKSLTKKWIGAQIVEKDGKYVVEWYPWEYWDILNKITDRVNSLKANLANKKAMWEAWEEVEITSNTSQFEDLISDLKWFSIREPNAEVRQKFLEIESDLIDDLKWSMSAKDYEKYNELLNNYSKLKTKSQKVGELEQKMSSKSVIDQPKMSDWQYLSDFLKELTEDWTISKNAADRRIAAIFADAFYWWPVKDTDRLMYPSVPWFLEAIMKTAVQIARNPRSKFTWGWGKYATDYTPSKLRTATNNILKQAQTTTVGKISSNSERE